MTRIGLLLVLIACGGGSPATRYYQLAEPRTPTAQDKGVALVIEPLVTDAAYDDERIVYRQTPYRLDYYQYHRWSAAPGTLVGNYLERAFEHSGRFSSVVREANPAAPVILRGRVVALEEVDHSKAKWLGRIVLELQLVDRAGNIIWSQQYEETEPLQIQSPEGLAKAISTALERIALRAIPVVAVLAEEHTGQRQARLRN